MRFLAVGSYELDKAEAVTERTKSWTCPEGIKIILPGHVIIGQTKSITVIDIEDPKILVKINRAWRDIMIFKFYPIMETSEILKIE